MEDILGQHGNRPTNGFLEGEAQMYVIAKWKSREVVGAQDANPPNSIMGSKKLHM